MSLHVRSDRLETSVDAFLYRNLLEPVLYPEGEVEAGPPPHLQVQPFLDNLCCRANNERARRTEKMAEERRLVWRMLHHWREIVHGGAFRAATKSITGCCARTGELPLN